MSSFAAVIIRVTYLEAVLQTRNCLDDNLYLSFPYEGSKVLQPLLAYGCAESDKSSRPRPENGRP
jgi:hypothetical protein